jgi:glyoxylase-like metal-dependent hydrolase (beta-lactamase superfamily II)
MVALYSIGVVMCTCGQVPAWDARGLGSLPWQGIACLDVSDDGRWIALGTIAPPGDPNVVLLDAEGNVSRTAQAGQRWIQQVAVGSAGKLHALSTMPEGAAGDFPTVYACGHATIPIPPQLGEPGWRQNLFHYGAHSNHTGVQLHGYRGGGIAVYDTRVLWLDSDDGKPTGQVTYPRPPDGVTVALTADAAGRVLVACTGTGSQANVFLLEAGKAKPLWSRPTLAEVDRVAPPEKGRYGTPTLPDGRREELPQRDVAVSAALSLALDAGRIATADYPGWQRWIRSSATGRDQHYGTRFLPARPVISIHDDAGKLIRRFGPEQFPHAGWLDLCFAGKYLLAYPHHWTCRGLAGQPTLPADDQARTLVILEPDSGQVRHLDFPDAIADVSAAAGRVAVACWDGKVYLLDDLTQVKLPGIEIGGPALVRLARDGRLVIASSAGVVRMFDGAGEELWRKDLNRALKPTLKPWVANARATPLGAGVWQLPGGRVQSDLGGQRVVEAPDGLILIEAHAGLSFEREWEAMKNVGLDPRRVKYVLATHEHGDHAPGAYLWRVVTGARFVCSEEMAYNLRHHSPISTGYGLHPPVPTDLTVASDTELDLAGLKVKALRLPGHTFGSMGWLFTKADKSYIAFGDLIMPKGPLGYAGSINFSARDVLSSLRKLEALKPDFALPGHGATGDTTPYIADGIQVGKHVGWGKMPPEKPDPYFRIAQKNVRVVAWNIDATSADWGDLDGDGRPDLAVVAPAGAGSVVKLFLNHSGTFRDQPDHVIPLPNVAEPSKIRLRQLNGDRRADILIGGKSAALLMSRGTFPNYDTTPLALSDANQARVVGEQIVIAPRFGNFRALRPRAGGFDLVPLSPDVPASPYADLHTGDVNGDGRSDLITSRGAVYLRQPDGNLPKLPSQQLAVPDAKDWTNLAVGDFNADGRPDIVLLSYGMKAPRATVFYNKGRADQPFAEQPDATLDLADPALKQNQPPLVRDTPVVADWNGDGVADLVIGKGQHHEVLILLGHRAGLDLQRSTRLSLDYRLHYETGLHVADFDGDGLPDLACFGSSTTLAASGPLAVYLWLQPK